MDYARWTVRNSQRGDGEVDTVAYWEAAARRGNPDAIEALRMPPFPDTLMYLWKWFLELHGRSGAHMSGINPMSYSEIADWARLTDQHPEPYEVRALIELDSVLLDRDGAEPDITPPEPPPAWPEKD
jgi:hypothetical protein